MFWTDTATGSARMEDDNDDLLATVPDDATREPISRPLVDAWKIVIKKLAPETPLETTIRAAQKLCKSQNVMAVITWTCKVFQKRTLFAWTPNSTKARG